MQNLRTGNFDSLVISGLGAIGGSLLALGAEEIESFDNIILVDQDRKRLERFAGKGYRLRHGDIEDKRFLAGLAEEIPGTGLFVNVCANVNNLGIRQTLAPRDVAYLDSCASTTADREEHRFSKMMPHTLKPVESRHPHWLCWGVNPGLVEIIARKLIHDFHEPGGSYDVSVFEYDELRAPDNEPTVAVGWCPAALIEEVMQSPTLVLAAGRPVEEETDGARKIMAFWEGQPVESRIVAHEDIWNMAFIHGVESARFIYALHPRVMAVLAGKVRTAEKTLTVPPFDTPLFGAERLAVTARNMLTGDEKALVWETNHQATWEQYGVNAVQFQTAKSLLLAMALLQKTRYGALAGSYCAAELPAGPQDWRHIEQFMAMLGIVWEDAGHLALRAEEYEELLSN